MERLKKYAEKKNIIHHEPNLNTEAHVCWLEHCRDEDEDMYTLFEERGERAGRIHWEFDDKIYKVFGNVESGSPQTVFLKIDGELVSWKDRKYSWLKWICREIFSVYAKDHLCTVGHSGVIGIEFGRLQELGGIGVGFVDTEGIYGEYH